MDAPLGSGEDSWTAKLLYGCDGQEEGLSPFSSHMTFTVYWSLELFTDAHVRAQVGVSESPYIFVNLIKFLLFISCTTHLISYMKHTKMIF